MKKTSRKCWTSAAPTKMWVASWYTVASCLKPINVHSKGVLARENHAGTSWWWIGQPPGTWQDNHVDRRPLLLATTKERRGENRPTLSSLSWSKRTDPKYLFVHSPAHSEDDLGGFIDGFRAWITTNSEGQRFHHGGGRPVFKNGAFHRL